MTFVRTKVRDILIYHYFYNQFDIKNLYRSTEFSVHFEKNRFWLASKWGTAMAIFSPCMIHIKMNCSSVCIFKKEYPSTKVLGQNTDVFCGLTRLNYNCHNYLRGDSHLRHDLDDFRSVLIITFSILNE